MEDLLSEKVDNSSLRTPLKAENVSTAWDFHPNASNNSKKHNEELLDLSKHVESELEEFESLHMGPTENDKDQNKIVQNTESQQQNDQPAAIQNTGDIRNEPTVRFTEQVIPPRQILIIPRPQANMAEMWLKMAKQVPEISSRDSADSIYEAVDKLRQYGKLVPIEQWNLFFKQISGKFDSEIRKYVLKETEKLTDSDKLCDLIEEKFVSKGSYLKNFEEIQTIKKRKGETFRDFGKRILKMKELIDKQYLFRHRDQENITRSQDLEVIALNSFLKYVRTCPALLIAIGNPKNIQQAVDATEKHEPDLDIAEVDEDTKLPVSQANAYRRTTIGCQKCSNDGHEAFYCPASECIYCKSTMHKSAECNVVPGDVKIAVQCKDCKLPGHTIDACPRKNSRESYCQFCQAANSHIASSCELAAKINSMAELEGAMNNVSLNRNVENGMSSARWGSRYAIEQRYNPQQNQYNAQQGQYNAQQGQYNTQQGQWGSTCYNCGNQGHLARNCPRGRNQRGNNRGRGGFQRGRGYNQNQSQNNGNNNQNYNSRNFNRGGRGGRGYNRGRGNYQGYNNQGYQNRVYQNQGYPNYYGNPQTNPFLYPPYYPTGQNVPNWFFANPGAAALPGPSATQPAVGQNPIPTVTMPKEKTEN